MGPQQLVRAGEAEFYVELTEGGAAQNVGLDAALSFDGVTDTIKAIAGELAQAWDHAKPSRATAEFGLALTAKPGKVTGLLVEGGGTASLKLTLTWEGEPAA